MSEGAVPGAGPATAAPASVPVKGTFRRPARAAARAAAVVPAEAPTSVPVGFRTHSDALSGEAFVFSTKTLPPPTGQNEVIVEIVPTAPQFSGAIPKPASLLDASATQHMLGSMTVGGGPVMGEGRTPNGWICRAYCKDDKHAQHALGAISVHQRLMDIRFLCDSAKGKAHARILSYTQASQWYGAEFVELTIQDQFISRSDMFLITEALRDRVLYLGQELTYEGFRLRVSDMLVGTDGASTPSANFEKLPSGLVTQSTKINFLSLSFVYTIMIELSAEMWDQSLDGRVMIDWAVERFLKEHSEQFPKYRSHPLVRFVFFGRLRFGYCIPGPSSPHGSDPFKGENAQRDVFHQVVVPQGQDLLRLSEIAKSHLEVLLDRVSELTQIDGTPVHPRDLFTPARYSNLLPALNIVLEFYNHHHLDRRLDVTGQAITVITASNGLYHVANDLSQITATKMLDIGIRKCMIVCMGRPPLHKTPLLEYCSDDASLKSQYQLQMDPRARERFYERPLWAECYFYHPLLHRGPVGAGYHFALLSKEQWDREFPFMRDRQHRYHTGLLLPVLPKPSIVCRAAPLMLNIPTPVDSSDTLVTKQVYVRAAEPKVASVASYQQYMFSTTPQKSSHVSSKHPRMTNLANSRKSGGVLGTDFERKATVGAPFVDARWYKHTKNTHDMDLRCPEKDFTYIVSANVLDEDLLQGILRLDLTINTAELGGWAWNPEIITKPATIGAKLMSSFVSSVDDVTGDINLVGTPGPRGGGYRSRSSRWAANHHFTIARCRIHGLTLSLYSARALPHITFDFPEDLMFTFQPELFVPEAAAPLEGNGRTASPGTATAPVDSSSKPISVHMRQTASVEAGDTQSMAESAFGNHSMFRSKQGQTVPIGSIQIRSSILFAVRPTNPFDDTTDANSTNCYFNTEAGNHRDVYVSAAKVQQLRWQAAHPERRHDSVWSILCTVPILPLYGQRPEYSQDSMRDDVRRQYWMPKGQPHDAASVVPLLIKEYLLQRLHQQYQIVTVRHQGSYTIPPHHDSATAQGGVATVTTASGSSWSRRLQPFEEIDLTIGHQNQTLKIADDGSGLFVHRSLHKGMYESNTAHLVTYEFMLLNHADLAFHPKVVKLEAAIGERARFDWRTLDEYLSHRNISTIPDTALRDRQVCFVLLPSEKMPHRRQKPVVPFDSFKAFVTSRFSTKLKPREGTQDDLWVSNNEPLVCVSNTISALSTIDASHPSTDDARRDHHFFLQTVALEHNRDDPIDAPDRILRRPVDPNGQTKHDVFIDDRVMGADIDLSPYYHEECAYVMRLSWLCCASTIINDWTKGLQHNASKYNIHVVQVPSTYDISMCGCHLQSQFHAIGEFGIDEHLFRSDLLMRLAKEFGYFPETREMNRNCRLIHSSGLCFVASLPDHHGLVWSENYVWKTGCAEQRVLLEDFRDAVSETNRSLRKGTMIT